MLFYERRLPEHLKLKHADLLATPPTPPSVINHKATAQSSDKSGAGVSKEDESNETTKATSTADSDVAGELSKPKPIAADDKPEIDIVNKDVDVEQPQASTSAAARNMADKSTSPHDSVITSTSAVQQIITHALPKLSKELEDWIWQDNRQFLQDRNIFEHTYFK